MTSFKRWFGAGAIVLVALALIACPAMLPTVADEIGDMKFDAGDIGEAKTVSSLGDYFNARDNATYDASSSDDKVATASVAGTTLTVTAKGPGTANVTVTANDRDGTVTQKFSVTVDKPTVVDPPVNKPPVSKTIPDVPSLQMGTTKMLALSKYYTDSDGDALQYTAASGNKAVATVTDPDAGSMITITAVAAGTATITVTANDGTNAAVAQTFDVTVTAPVVVPNDPPVSKTIPDVVPLQMGTTKMLALSKYYTDSDGDALTYTAASGNEAVATVTDPDDATSMITITAVAAGTATITVSASDRINDPVAQTFDVTVTAKPVDNERPELRLRIEDQSLTIVDAPTLAIDLTPHFLDPDHDPLTFAASSDASNVAEEMVDGSTLTITAVAAGTANITVTASDDHESVSWTFQVTVNPESNKAPIVIPGSSLDVVVTVGGAAKEIDLSVYFADPENRAMTYTAEPSDGPTATAVVVGSKLTVTAVAAGMAKIKVTATDDGKLSASLDLMVQVLGTPNVAPVAGVIPDQSLVMDFAMTATVDLSLHFSDSMDNGPSPLTYTRASSDDMVATAMVDGSMLTITAVAAGKTTITVTASDGADQAEATFTVTVSNPPAPTSTDDLPDKLFAHDDMDARTYELSKYFSGAMRYTVTSSDIAVVKAEEEAGTLTVTPVGPGVAVVTVTPINSGGSGTAQTITVTVDSVPVPTLIKTLRDLSPFASDDDPRTITLSEYFSGATRYTVTSSNPSVVTAVEKDGVLTVTAVGHGTALVTVMPINSGGSGTARTILVTVRARPMKNAGSLEDIRMEAKDEENTEELALNSDFSDLDGTITKYSTKTDDAKTVAVYPTGEPPTPTSLNSAKMADGDKVTLEAQKAGTANITVTVTDNHGLTETVTFSVMVIADNTAPKREKERPTTGVKGEYTGADRLKMDDAPKKVIDAAEFKTYFKDVDLAEPYGDLLTFSVKNVKTGDSVEDAALDDEKVVADVTITPLTWDGDLGGGGPDKFTVTVSPKKEGAAHDILIFATDIAGEKSEGLRISVQVNRPPVAKAASGEAKPVKLSEYTGAEGIASGRPVIKLDLKKSFSDPDTDALTFVAVPSVTGSTAPAVVKVNGNELQLDVVKLYSAKLVPMTVTVHAVDSVGEKSPTQTFTVSVTHVGKDGSVR